MAKIINHVLWKQICSVDYIYGSKYKKTTLNVRFACLKHLKYNFYAVHMLQTWRKLQHGTDIKAIIGL